MRLVLRGLLWGWGRRGRKLVLVIGVVGHRNRVASFERDGYCVGGGEGQRISWDANAVLNLDGLMRWCSCNGLKLS